MKKPGIPLVWQIVVGLVAGIVIGYLLNLYPAHSAWLIEQIFKPAGDIFIKLMKMIVIPVVFRAWWWVSQVILTVKRWEEWA